MKSGEMTTAETGLVKYDAMTRAIAEAVAVDEAKRIRDKARALEVYAQQAMNLEDVWKVAVIKIRAERRAGQLLKEQVKHEGGRPGKHCPEGSVLTGARITHKQSSKWQQLADVPEDKFENYLAELGIPTTAGALRAARRHEASNAQQARAQNGTTTEDLATLIEGGQRFGTIYADPPWQYSNQGTRGSTGNHYNGLTVEEICSLPISLLAADASHLHLWTTNGFLRDAFIVVEAWGFAYKSCFIWVKPQIGMGNYWRVAHEFLLLGVKGSCPFVDKTLRSWAEYRRAKHSAKPEEIRELLERASPGPRLELFARLPTEGWTAWGNEISKDLFAA